MLRALQEEHAVRGTAELPVGIYTIDMCREGEVSLQYHSEFEFFAVKEGEAAVQLEGELLHLTAEEGAFINSQFLHSYAPLPGAPSCVVLAIVFSPHWITQNDDNLYQKYILPLLSQTLSVPFALPPDAAALAFEIEKLSAEAVPGYELAIRGDLLRMLSYCIAGATKNADKKHDARADFIKKVMEYIHDNYQNEITLAELAACAHIGKEHLCRIFKGVAAVSPIVYLNRYRVNRSLPLLQDSSQSISDIAVACGFNNSSYFAKMFKRFMHCTPMQYRQKSNTALR